MRALIAPLILVAALTGCAPGIPSTPPVEDPTPDTPTPAALAPCADGTITPTIGEADGTAGHLNYQIVFTNSGPECTLEGYPQVAILGQGNGTQFGVVAEQMTGMMAGPVTIATGASAHARLEVVNIDPGGGPLGPDCGLDFGDGYNIYIPGAIEPTFVPAPGVAACTSGIPWMQIAPISAS
jgi:hypothetical protein